MHNYVATHGFGIQYYDGISFKQSFRFIVLYVVFFLFILFVDNLLKSFLVGDVFTVQLCLVTYNKFPKGHYIPISTIFFKPQSVFSNIFDAECLKSVYSSKKPERNIQLFLQITKFLQLQFNLCQCNKFDFNFVKFFI